MVSILFSIFLFRANKFKIPIIDARSLATSHDCKYVEVSALLDHNVDTLLVGIVQQIRLKVMGGSKKKKLYIK